jgi:hypothetical protein
MNRLEEIYGQDGNRKLVENFGLNYALNGNHEPPLFETTIVFDTTITGDLTFFAPTNAAWLTYPGIQAFSTTYRSGYDVMLDILSTHIHAAEVFYEELVCNSGIRMINGQSTETKCDNGWKYQVGGGNLNDGYPQILDEDILASNGLIHTIDEVILPHGTESPSTSPSSVPSSAPSSVPSSTPSVSSAPSSVPISTPSF